MIKEETPWIKDNITRRWDAAWYNLEEVNHVVRDTPAWWCRNIRNAGSRGAFHMYRIPYKVVDHDPHNFG